MKKILYLIALILLLSACQPADQQATGTETGQKSQSETSSESENKNPETEEKKGVYQKISAEQAKQKIDNEEVILVDVRTEGEYKSGHIPNAILLPNETIGDEAPAELPDKDATILLYCRSGNRSSQAAHKLIELGYRNVYDFGSIGDWKYEIVTE